MNLPAADHPIWKVIRLVVVGLIMAGVFWSQLVYKNPIELSDIEAILIVLGVLGGFDFAKMKLTKETKQ